MKRIISALAFCVPALLPAISSAATSCDTLVRNLMAWDQNPACNTYQTVIANVSGNSITGAHSVEARGPLYFRSVNPSSALYNTLSAERSDYMCNNQNFCASKAFQFPISFGYTYGSLSWSINGATVPMTCVNNVAYGFGGGYFYSISFQKTTATQVC